LPVGGRENSLQLPTTNPIQYRCKKEEEEEEVGWSYLLIQGKSALDDTVGVLHSRLQSLVARFLHRFPHLRLVHPQKSCCSCRHGPLGLLQRASSPCILAAEIRHALASELYAKSVLRLLSLSRAHCKP